METIQTTNATLDNTSKPAAFTAEPQTGILEKFASLRKLYRAGDVKPGAVALKDDAEFDALCDMIPTPNDIDGMTAKVLPVGAKGTQYRQSHRKENGGFSYEFAALVMEPSSSRIVEMKAVVTLRLYWSGTGTTCSACIWTHGGRSDTYRNGSGQAGGGGYCKKSAAAGEAIRNAGFELSEDIHGRGEDCIRRAVIAVAAAIGYPEAKLHIAHA